jgi:hypothetical protein
MVFLSLLMQPLDLDAQLGTQLGIEIGQRLVEQEHVDIAHQRPADGDALALTTGKLCRLALEQGSICKISAARATARRSRPSACGLVLQPEAQIALDRHLRIERIGLEHHADAAILGLAPR